MLDFNHILNTPGYDIQEFYGSAATTTVGQYKTWIKPRGVKMTYIMCVGGGGSGSCGGNNLGTNSGGGAGGAAGNQSTLLVPSCLIPDVLYVQAGMGGNSVWGTANAGVSGTASMITVEPVTSGLSNNDYLIWASAGGGGAAPSVSAGGVAGAAAAGPSTVGWSPLAGRGIYTFLVGQSGAAGGNPGAAGGNVTSPITGLMVTGGAGGGGCGAAAATQAGGTVTAIGLAQMFPGVVGGASGATPNNGSASPFRTLGQSMGLRGQAMLYGGSGGSSANGVASQIPGAGGPGAPGCGGGGSGGSGSGTAQVVAPSGAGGPGFVWIISW